MALLDWQKQVAQDQARFIVIAGGRRLGKSRFASRKLRAEAIQKPNAIFGYVAPTFQQAHDIVWEYLIKDCNDLIAKQDNSNLRVKLKNDTEIRLYSWDAIDRLLGTALDGIILDEVAIYSKFKYGWQNVVRPTLIDSNGWAMFISMPRGFNHFETLHTNARRLSDWSSYTFSTYENNMISRQEIDSIKQEISESAFNQEILAQFTKFEGMVYEEWSRAMIKPLELTPKRYYAGIDFGYNHPFAMSILAENDGVFHLVDEIYERKLGVADRNRLVKEMLDKYNPERCVADSEDPLSIQELRTYTDFNIESMVKGKDSVITGIRNLKNLMSQGNFFVTENCYGFIDEVENYCWKQNKDGDNKDEPIKEGDDMLDSVRYALSVTANSNSSIDWDAAFYI
jgi:hypothetical protein